MTGTLYLVATPIGNLGDISARALETLRAVDVIACEDTRHTRKLLTHFGISSRLVSYHQHNESERAAEFVESLKNGRNIAVVTDAGTPGISDPAFRVVAAAIEAGAPVSPIPGAVAFVCALVVSGLPTDSHFFGGFLPAKKTERIRRLREVENVPATLVFYETPHRLKNALQDCLEVLGNRRACVAREITKLHEEIARGDLQELLETFLNREPRGEIVLLIDREEVQSSKFKVQSSKNIAERVAELEAAGLDHRAALKQAAREFDLNRSEAYRQLQRDKSRR